MPRIDKDLRTLRDHINKHLRRGGDVTLVWHRRTLNMSWDTEHVIDGARVRRNKLQVREVSQMTSIKSWKPWRDEFEVRYDTKVV